MVVHDDRGHPVGRVRRDVPEPEGSGGMFVQSEKFVQAHSDNRGNISVYGQESNADTWKMAKMNMAIRGIDANFGSYHADTFFNDLHKTLKSDFIMANPPFNLSNWGADKLKDDVRWKYGTPPSGNANYAWIQHMIHHLAPNGKIGLVLANGALSSQSSGEGEIRRKIIEDNLIEGIVAGTRKLDATVEVDHARGGTKVPVGLGREVKLARLSPASQLGIVRVVPAVGNRLMWDVGNGRDQIGELPVKARAPLVELGDATLVGGDLGLRPLRLILLALPHQLADELGPPSFSATSMIF